jgi:hypothetical protein
MKLLSIILVFAASSAFAEVYTWHDARGAHHYTNRPDEIPVRYRAGAKSLNYGAEPQSGAPSSQQVQPAAPAEQPTARIAGVNPVQQITPPHLPGSGVNEFRQQSEERRQAKKKARAGRSSRNQD